ncbi:MAG TPA: hypothetical protein VFA85_00530 [Terriglobales bacterium]|nr:hypothetical protein [Terriglobales bacterium]
MTSSIYAWLLFLYPGSYRQEFGEEMRSVFGEARSDLRQTLPAKLRFYFREFCGLLRGALYAHFDRLFGPVIPFRRFHMQPRFRFPHSAVVLMCLILAGVVLAIEKAKTVVQMNEGLPAGTAPAWHPLFWLYPLAAALAVGAVAWGILFALKRTGMHRLANLQTSHEQH